MLGPKAQGGSRAWIRAPGREALPVRLADSKLYWREPDSFPFRRCLSSIGNIIQILQTHLTELTCTPPTQRPDAVPVPPLDFSYAG